MEDVNIEDFKVKLPFRLVDYPTLLESELSTNDKEEALNKVRNKLKKLQDTMYAHNKYSMLIVLQGMDTSGKDSLIREVFKEINPRGVVVHSFKTPTSNELEHDYLWRHYIALPEKGKIGVFNRSHYENVLVTRVHPEYVLNENLPNILSVDDLSQAFWDRRMEDINNFEKHLARNGMIILKFYLNLSKEEQRQRLLRRLEKEKHNWKFSVGDLKERKLWEDYMKYYEEAIDKTNTDVAPWYAIPADDKEMSRYIVGKVVLEELRKHSDIQNPELDEKVQDNIAIYRRQLESEDK